MSALPETATDRQAAISIEAFEDGSIDPGLFDHEAHVYIGWAYLQDYELQDGIARFCAALRRLTTKLGIESKYHETITWFFMILIAERRSRDETEDWSSFKRRNPDLFATAPSIIRRYYSSERLGSSRARHQFLLPDRPAV
jgi:hypothetical protein